MIKGSFPISKVLVFEGNSYVCWKNVRKNEDIRQNFMIATYVEKMKILDMVKNVIKGSFPMSKVLVFEGNSYVCWKNENIRLFYDCTW